MDDLKKNDGEGLTADSERKYPEDAAGLRVVGKSESETLRNEVDLDLPSMANDQTAKYLDLPKYSDQSPTPTTTLTVSPALPANLARLNRLRDLAHHTALPKDQLAHDQLECFADDFWPEYPRKVGKYEACKSFCRLVLDAETFGAVMVGLAWYQRHEWQERPPDKIPHASTWLNQRRWLDAPSDPRAEDG